MGSLTGVEILAIVLVVVVCAAMAAVGLLLLQRLRRRREQIRGELSGRPEAVSDRAFNRIAMARREAGVLAAQGTELPRARELLGEAQAAFDLRQFDRAYSLAQSSHEALVAARQRPPSAVRATSVPPEAAAEAPTSPAAEAPLPAAKLPAHRAEAQFQLRLLEEDVNRARSARPSDGRTLQASALLAQAQAAFDRSEFQEAFRLALKGRREAGGTIQTLPPAPGSRGPPASGAPDPALAADAAAAATRCPACGHPMLADDGFCRGCGTPRAPLACPSCGAARAPADTFCGKCGLSFS